MVKCITVERYTRLLVHTRTSYSEIASILLIYGTKNIYSKWLMAVKCRDVLTK